MKRFNKTNGMYALLVAVAALIGVTIYGSCSADEDYGDYSSRDELFTLADGIMGRGVEGVIYEWYEIDSGNAVTSQSIYFGTHCFEIEANISWRENKIDANLSPVSCSLAIKNNDFISFNNENISPLPRYVLSYQKTGDIKSLNPTYSELTVEEHVTCYQVQYDSQGHEVGREQVGVQQGMSFRVDITNYVTYRVLCD